MMALSLLALYGTPTLFAALGFGLLVVAVLCVAG